MPSHEYKVVPAPERARKVRGLKGADLFAHEMEALMNTLAAEGWHYLRADTLPQEERSGLTSRTTTYRNLLIFRRETVVHAAAPTPRQSARPQPAVQDEDDIDNLWNPADPAPKPEGRAPLIADRQGKGVDF